LLAIADLRPPGAVHDTVDGIPGLADGRKPAESAQSSQKYALALEIGLLDRFGGQIKVFVNKMVAHRDSDASEIAIPNIGVMEKAIFCYHALFRKYAFIIAGIPCDFRNPNPLDLLPATDQRYTTQFTRLWLADSGN
jgi:hypothetical protein